MRRPRRSTLFPYTTLFRSDARRKIVAFLGSPRILQIIERAAVSDTGNQRAELQRRHFDSLAEARHSRHAAIHRRLGRKRTRMFFRNLVTGEFAQTEQSAVMRNRFKSHASAKLFEKEIVRMRQGFGEI